jgi:hypothetical protein
VQSEDELSVGEVGGVVEGSVMACTPILEETSSININLIIIIIVAILVLLLLIVIITVICCCCCGKKR